MQHQVLEVRFLPSPAAVLLCNISGDPVAHAFLRDAPAPGASLLETLHNRIDRVLNGATFAVLPESAVPHAVQAARVCHAVSLAANGSEFAARLRLGRLANRAETLLTLSARPHKRLHSVRARLLRLTSQVLLAAPHWRLLRLLLQLLDVLLEVEQCTVASREQH